MTSLPAAVNSDSLKAYKEKALADFHSTSGYALPSPPPSSLTRRS